MKTADKTRSANTPAIMLLTEESRQEFISDITQSVLNALHQKGFVSADSRGPEDSWGTRQDACTLLKCSLPTLHMFMSRGAIIFQKIGRKTLVNLSDLQRKLEAGQLAKYHRK